MSAKNKKARNGGVDIWPAFQPDKDNGSVLGIPKDKSDKVYENISEEEKAVMDSMLFLALNGVTPEDYENYYNVFKFTRKLVEDSSDKAVSVEDEADFPDSLLGNSRRRPLYDVKQYEPYNDADARTLVLKIQMKDITHPPMWREVEVPANFNFVQLHDIIQTVTDFENCHLWQFNKRAYDDGLLIGIKMDRDDPFSMGVADVTHDAYETPLTQFLHSKGDKLEYIYDFGDDWIFTVEVKDVLEKRITHPVCTKFKSELNPIEDFGGIWSYMQTRSDIENWPGMTKKQKKECAADFSFDSPEEYIKCLDEHKIDLDCVNESLKGI